MYNSDMDKALIDNMVQMAKNVINKFGDGQNHTVGAAVATKDGSIVTGINLFHFTGGPCGEMVALANAISQGDKDLIAVVAVGDNDRGVLPPCGRCRQILFDFYPEMQVVHEQNSTYDVKPIRELLPDIYDWREHQAKGINE